METLLEYKGDTMIVRMMGELDQHYAAELRRAIDAQVTHRGIHKIVFDFSNVGFMDSSGIGLVMGRYKYVVEKRGKVIIISSNVYIDRIIKMSGLLKIVEVYTDLNSALENIKEVK